MNVGHLGYIIPRTDLADRERRGPICTPRDDPFFQGWRPNV